MPDRAQTLAKTLEWIEPFNKKGVAVTEATRFAQDLEWDSLTVLDFVANVEDEVDVLITMNMQAEIETVGQLVDALGRLTATKCTTCSPSSTTSSRFANPSLRPAAPTRSTWSWKRSK